jgi:hypothetical protein
VPRIERRLGDTARFIGSGLFAQAGIALPEEPPATAQA